MKDVIDLSMSLGIGLLLFSILFILITDRRVKQGKVLEIRNILIIKALGIVFLFISIGVLIAES